MTVIVKKRLLPRIPLRAARLSKRGCVVRQKIAMKTAMVIAIAASEAARRCDSYSRSGARRWSPTRMLMGFEIGNVIEAAFAMKATANGYGITARRSRETI